MNYSHAAIQCASCFLLICLAAAVEPAVGEVVKLRDGREIVCKVVRQDETRVWVRADSALMVLDRSQIVSIESGLSDAALLKRLGETLQEARRLLARGRTMEARRRLERELWLFDQELSAIDTPSSELLGMRRRLRELHYNALANDPDQREAQRLYEEAQACLNRIDYPGAYEYLMRATSLAPNRLDIQYHLAETAELLGKSRVAMDAYRAILAGDHVTYYDSVARSYLNHLLRHGRRSLMEDRARASLPYYEEIVLLMDDQRDEPVKLDEFGRRLERRRAQSRIEILIDVFEYARPRVMVNLAKAAIEEAHELDPDNDELARNLVIWRFLSLLKRLVQQGKHDEIIKLKSDMPAWALEDPEVRALIEEIESSAGESMKARMLLVQVEEPLAVGNCEQAVHIAQRLIEQYPETPFAERAREIVARCRAEIAIREGIARASNLISELKISEARALIEQLIEMAKAAGLDSLDELQALASRAERELKAAELWSDAAHALSMDQIDEGTIALETLIGSYPKTQYGRYASLWMTENGDRLRRRGYVLANMTQGVASIVLNASRTGGGPGSSSEARLRNMSSLEALIDADRPNRGTDWFLVIQIAAPILLAIFILALLLRKLVWPGAARFGLQMDEYFEAKRFRADAWGSSEEISGVPIDKGPPADANASLAAALFPDDGAHGDGKRGSRKTNAADAPTLCPATTGELRARVMSEEGAAGAPTPPGRTGTPRKNPDQDANHRAAPKPRRSPGDTRNSSRERRSS